LKQQELGLQSQEEEKNQLQIQELLRNYHQEKFVLQRNYKKQGNTLKIVNKKLEGDGNKELEKLGP
jgi:hypothetical protein